MPWAKRLTSGAKQLRDVVVAEPLADDVGVLALDQRVVVGAAGAGLGEALDAQLLEQRGDAVVDVLAAVVGVEAEDREREGQQQALEQRHQEALGDADHGADELELGDLVDQVDQVDALDAVAVALVDRVDPDVARHPLRLGRLAQADAHAGALRLRPRGARGAVGRRAAQVVDVAVGDRREPLVRRLAEHLALAPQHLARGQPGHLVERLVHLRQQPDVRRRVLARERPAPAAAAPVPDRAGIPPLAHQALHLLARDARGGDQEAQHHALVALAETPLAEPVQGVPHEAVRLVAALGLEVHRLVAFDEGPKLPHCA